MTKEKIKIFLDYIPLVILIISAIILIITTISNGTGLLWKHVTGLLVLPINIGFFLWRHKIGVLALGVTIILGLVGFLSYSYTISTNTIYFGKSENFKIPIFYGQSIFLLWLLIHFIISVRHYIGIGTKKYWSELFNSANR